MTLPFRNDNGKTFKPVVDKRASNIIHTDGQSGHFASLHNRWRVLREDESFFQEISGSLSLLLLQLIISSFNRHFGRRNPADTFIHKF